MLCALTGLKNTRMRICQKQISEFIQQTKGIDLSGFDSVFLNKTIQRRITETECESEEDYYRLLEFDSEEAGTLQRLLQINYSEFFRNPLTFAVLEKIVLPAMALAKAKSQRDEIRIWSAACGSGQEVYSLSMLLNELSVGRSGWLNFRFFATDIAESALTEARDGIYAASRLSRLNAGRIKAWFTKSGNSYIIDPRLRERVDFSVFNLLNEKHMSPPASIYGEFDIILCANVLFYFNPDARTTIIEKINHSLTEGGYLITGETERDIFIKNNFREVFPHSAIFQRF